MIKNDILNINKYILFSYSFNPPPFCKMDAFLLMRCVCDVENGRLKAFDDEHNPCTKDHPTTTSSHTTTHKSYNTPVAFKTRSPMKPRKTQATRPPFRPTGADIVRALTFD